MFGKRGIMNPINSISKRLRDAALVAALGMASADAAPLLDPTLFMTPEEKEAYAERVHQEELRKDRQKEFRERVRRAAAGDHDAIVELRGTLLVALLESGSGASDAGVARLRLLLDELARIEGCTR